MARRPDWEPRLSAYLAATRGKPHAYGRHDCMTFCAGALKAVTGKDFARGHRGKCRSPTSAHRYLKSLGYGSPAEMIDSLLAEKPVMKAGRGDIVLDDEGVPGVCIGGDALMVGMEDGENGLVRVPRARWAKAWAV